MCFCRLILLGLAIFVYRSGSNFLGWHFSLVTNHVVLQFPINCYLLIVTMAKIPSPARLTNMDSKLCSPLLLCSFMFYRMLFFDTYVVGTKCG